MVRVSIDPGTGATGVCVWSSKGIVIQLFTLRPHKDANSPLLRSLSLGLQLKNYLAMYAETYGVVASVALEAWEFHSDHDDEAGHMRPKKAMIACGTTLGALAMTASGYTSDIRHVTKGQISKEQSKLLAKSLGVIEINAKGEPMRSGHRVSKDAIDAFQIGVCAGFDRKANKG